MSQRPVDIEVWIHHETDSAYLVSLPAEMAEKVWLPKSQIIMTGVGCVPPCSAEVTLPEWLAIEKELV